MKSAFGTRLFWLFLLFALIPSLILVLLGYYLAIAPPFENRTSVKEIVPALYDYFSASLDSAMIASLEESDDTTLPGNLDFILIFVDGELSHMTVRGDSIADARDPLMKCIAAGRYAGGVTINNRLYQYIGVPRGDSLLLGGIVHSPQLLRTMGTYQEARAAETSDSDLRSRYAVFLAIVFGAVALLAIGLAYSLSRRISRSLSLPLTQLNEATGRIASGQFGETVPVRGVGEIRELIENFNHMTGQLESTTARLVQSERVAAWRQVARRFAHELKNPLQPIAVSLYQIRKKVNETHVAPDISEPLQAIAEEVTHLTNMAERFSKLAQMPPANFQPHDLSVVLTSIADLYRERLAPYQFTFEIPDSPVTVPLDQTYFREAIHNLLQNSIEATQPGKQISLRLYTDPTSAFIEVADQGEGIPEHLLDQVSLPGVTFKPRGSGLGLAIVDQVVTQHRGSFGLASNTSTGTTVTICLPLLAGPSHG